jgi:hypothetical protein
MLSTKDIRRIQGI